MPTLLHAQHPQWSNHAASSSFNRRTRRHSSTTLARKRTLWLCIIATVVVLCYTPVVDMIVGHTEDSYTKGGPLAHLPRLLHLSRSEIATFVLSGIGLIIAAAGGIGGGGILIAVFIMVLGLSTKQAVPLANITILGGSIANVVHASPLRHPFADRPLLDWDLLLVMEPLTIAGAVAGAFVNFLLPGAIITALLLSVLAWAGIRTITKGVVILRKEGVLGSIGPASSPELQSLQVDTPQSYSSNGGPGSGDYYPRALDNASPSSDWVPSPLTHGPEEDLPSLLTPPTRKDRVAGDSSFPLEVKEPEDVDEEEQQAVTMVKSMVGGGICNQSPPHCSMDEMAAMEMVAMIKKEERGVILWKPMVLCLCFGGIMVLNILKGGGRINPLNLNCHSALYWGLTLAIIPWVMAFFIGIRIYLLKNYKLKAAIRYPYAPGDVRWDERATLVYPLLCITAGVIAGLLGVGGGVVKGPLMLEMGVPPEVAATTASFMIFLTSTTASASFLIFGLLPLRWGLVFFLWGLLCTALGQVLVSRLTKRMKGGQSLIVLSIGSVILISVVTMAIQFIQEIIHDPSSFGRTHSLCK